MMSENKKDKRKHRRLKGKAKWQKGIQMVKKKGIQID